MSFAEEVRVELAKVPMKKPCCRRAFSAGLLLGCGQAEKEGIGISLRDADSANAFCEILESTFCEHATSVEGAAYGKRLWTVTASRDGVKKLFADVIAVKNTEDILHFLTCDGCRAAFLRGVFVAAGTINPPSGNCHMEVLLPDGRGEEALSALLSGLGYPPKRIRRKKGVGLYYKKSVSVSDILSLIGSHHAIFTFLNGKIERDIRNNENRATNCVAKNIEKTVSACSRQVEAIDKLMTTGKLNNLSEELQATARLRYQNPDVSLDELTQLHRPAISRSGLNHRLKRLVEEAENL